MAELHRVGDLEIGQDLDYQKRAWTFERVGWIVMGLTAIMGLIGLLGPGWLSHTKAQSKDSSLGLEYDRFGRFQAPTTLRIHLGANAQQQDGVQVRIARNYLENVQIQQITPEPVSVQAHSKHLVYTFAAKLTQPTAITFYLEPEQIGMLPGSVELPGKQQINFKQFIYP